MTEENKLQEIEEKVNDTVSEMKEKIDNLTQEASKAKGTYAQKAKEVSKKAEEVLKQASDKLQEIYKTVKDPEEVKKAVDFVTKKSKEVYDTSLTKIKDFVNSEQVQKYKGEAVDFVKDTADKTGETIKEYYEKAMENPNVKEFAENVNKVFANAKSSVNEFLEKPEVQNGINKAKDKTIDVAEKAVAALKEWLKPEEKKDDQK